MVRIGQCTFISGGDVFVERCVVSGQLLQPLLLPDSKGCTPVWFEGHRRQPTELIQGSGAPSHEGFIVGRSNALQQTCPVDDPVPFPLADQLVLSAETPLPRVIDDAGSHHVHVQVQQAS